jgi:hypothetical protein
MNQHRPTHPPRSARSSRTVLAALVAGLVVTVACKDESVIDDFFASQDGLFETVCQCAVESGAFGSVTECQAEISDDTSDSCVQGVLEDNESAVSDTLRCLAGAYDDYSSCMASNGCGTDPCETAFENAADACPELPVAVESAIETQCDGGSGETFTCGDGETVPADYVCDDEADCSDGSDEANCVPFVCDDGTPIPAAYVCDGDDDCGDGSDEANCGA